MMNNDNATFKDIIRQEGVEPKDISKSCQPTSILDHAQTEAARDQKKQIQKTSESQKSQLKQRAAMSSHDDIDSWRAYGEAPNVLKRLRRGRPPHQRECDLHGETRDEAIVKLRHFIEDSVASNLESLLIICGRGTHSADNKSVLKPVIREFMRVHSSVRAFCHAQRADGADGAYYVLIRKRKRAR